MNQESQNEFTDNIYDYLTMVEQNHGKVIRDMVQVSVSFKGFMLKTGTLLGFISDRANDFDITEACEALRSLNIRFGELYFALGVIYFNAGDLSMEDINVIEDLSTRLLKNLEKFQINHTQH
jgi:hypothetical protein